MIKKSKVSNAVMGDDNLLREIANFLDQRNSIAYVNEFSEESAKQFFNDYTKAIRNGQNIFVTVIDSYGGFIDSLIFMMDIIDSSPIPVATVCVGKGMSCGSILLSHGTKGLRFISPNSRVMIHNVSSGSWGKQPEIQVDSDEVKRLQKTIFERMAKNCGKKKDFFLAELKKRGNTDWFLTAQEAKKMGIVDHIRIPTFSTNIQVQNIIS